MSKKARRNHDNADNRSSRTSIIAAAGVVLVLALLAGAFLYDRGTAESLQSEAAARQAALASEQAPMFGNPDAKVHIVEFLDPACETCAKFYPIVKGWMAEVPGEIRLSIRHVAFHTGADHAVKVLEASRNQGKYWETLEALLASQRAWTRHHTVLPENILPVIAGVGLNMEQLQADMNSPQVLQRIEQDKQDAILLKVAATPGYYVNGRPLTSFGERQLAELIREEYEKANKQD